LPATRDERRDAGRRGLRRSAFDVGRWAFSRSLVSLAPWPLCSSTPEHDHEEDHDCQQRETSAGMRGGGDFGVQRSMLGVGRSAVPLTPRPLCPLAPSPFGPPLGSAGVLDRWSNQGSGFPTSPQLRPRAGLPPSLSGLWRTSPSGQQGSGAWALTSNPSTGLLSTVLEAGRAGERRTTPTDGRV
jgi:hypothetical protein